MEEKKKLIIELTEQELEVCYRSLLEIPAKYALPVLKNIEQQVKEQENIKKE